MSILFFSRLFYPHIGGVEKHIFELSKLLIKKGYKITLVVEQDSREEKLEEFVDGIKVFRIPNLNEGSYKKFKIWKWLWKNLYLIKNADIVHCHDVFFWYLPFKFIFPFKKAFVTFHGYEGYPLRFKDILMHKISEIFSTGNICVGDFIKKWYKTNSSDVTYGAVNILRHESVANENSAIFIGRLDDQTGILTYVNAVNILKNKIPDFKLLIIGEGNLRNKIKINKNVEILNPSSKALTYFNNYNFAFVSRYLSMLEAMVARRLVFAVYDNPIKEDYLRMSPFSKHIVICDSISELVSKITFYLENSKIKKEKVEAAYTWAIKNTWEELMKKYIKLWEKYL